MITPFGLYEWVYMPFGLKNAAATYQKFMDEMLRGLTGTYAYLDDVLISAETEEENLQILEEVLRRISARGLRINPQKCEFLKDSLDFLGYHISAAGIKITKKKVDEVTEFPIPTTVKALRRFLGMCNYYRRTIPRFAEIVLPLTEKIEVGRKETKYESNIVQRRDRSFQQNKRSTNQKQTVATSQERSRLFTPGY